MDVEREVTRLAFCGLLSKEAVVISGFAEEVGRMAEVNDISEGELVRAINSLIDSPVKDHSGEPKFVTTAHIKTRVDYYRDQDQRMDDGERYKRDRAKWDKDKAGIPECWKVQEAYLMLDNPTEEDKQKVLDSIREEMKKYPVDSEMYNLWMKAGKTWKEVRV